MESKIIDVVCAVYNKRGYLAGFLDSFISLDSESFNLIIIDDGSSDLSYEFIVDYIRINEVNNIYVIKQDNHGVSHTRNVGLNKAVSKFIWFCDPDDVISHQANSMLNVVTKNDDVDLFVFSYFTKNICKETESKVLRENTTLDVSDFITFHSKFFNKYQYPATDGTLWDKVYKKSKIHKVLFDEALLCSEDFDYNYKVFSCINTVMLSSIPIYHYQVHGEGTLSSTFNDEIVHNRISVERRSLCYALNYYQGFKSVPVKNFVVKGCDLLSKIKYSNKDIFNFYNSEHESFSIDVKPFKDQKEKFMFYSLKYNFFEIANYIRLILKRLRER